MTPAWRSDRSMPLEFRQACLPQRLCSDISPAAEERSSSRELLLRLGIKLAPSRADLLNGCVRLWECVDGSQVVGHGAGDARTGEVLVLDVHHNYQGRGIGRQLLSLIVSWLRAEGVQRIWLAAPSDRQLRAFGFYRALGWRPTGVHVNSGNEVLELPAAAQGEAPQ